MKFIITILFLFLISISFSKQESQDFEVSLEDKTLDEKYKAYVKKYQSLLFVDNEKCLEYIEKAGEIARELNNKKYIGENLSSLGFYYDSMNDYPKAIMYYNKSTEYYFKFDSIPADFNLNNLGIIYSRLGDYSKSIEVLELSIELVKRSGNKANLVSKMTNLGNVYSRNFKTDAAKKIYFETLEIAIESDDTLNTAMLYGNIGNSYYIEEKYDSSLYYYMLSKPLFLSYGEEKYIASIYIKLSNIYTKLEKNNEAREYLDLAKSILERNKLVDVNAEYFYQESVYYNNLGNYNTTLVFLKKAEEIYEKVDKSARLLVVYSKFVDVYEALGDYKNAFYYSKELGILNDTLNQKNYTDAMASFEVRTNLAEKQAENDLLKEENSRKEIERYYLITIIVFGAILLLFILKRFYDKRKIAKILEAKNYELNDANATKDKFFSIIAHDLKNPVGNFKNLSEILYKDYSTFSDEERLDFLGMLYDSGVSLHELLENLLMWSRSQRGKIFFETTDVNLKELMQNNFNLFAIEAENKKIQLINNIPQDTVLNADPNMLLTIIRNITGNSIKFTKEGGSITANSRVEGDKTYISIVDTGVGMKKEKIESLFKIDKATSTPGTNNEKGTGLGLIIVKEFVDKHKGEIKVESELNIGTKTTVILPV